MILSYEIVTFVGIFQYVFYALMQFQHIIYDKVVLDIINDTTANLD